MLKLNEFSHNHHPPRVKMLVKYIRRGISVTIKLLENCSGGFFVKAWERKVAMRIALISDIHGNLPALEAVLADMRNCDVKRLVCLGDVVNLGPQSSEVLDQLAVLDGEFILGNHDEYMLDTAKTHDLKHGWFEEITTWTRSQLRLEHLDFIKKFQFRLDIPLTEKLQLSGWHSTPHSANEFLPPGASDDELLQAIKNEKAPWIACGHTHTPGFRLLNGQTLINPGSVGYPFVRPWHGEIPMPAYPWAEYAILDVMDDQANINFRRIHYDLNKLFQSAHDKEMPGAALWQQRRSST